MHIVAPRPLEVIRFKPVWTVEKWYRTHSHHLGYRPDEVVRVEGNLLLNAGITELLKLLGGTGGTAYSNANAYLYVGDSTTAAAASQTDLQASTNKLEKAMDATFPSVSAQTISWKSTYGSSDANYAWEEVGVKNGAGVPSGSVLLLNRKVQAFGTKASGSTWALTLDLTIS